MKMHPAAQKVIERIQGVTWHYQQFDYARSMGVCGETASGERMACIFSTIPRNGWQRGPKLFPTDYLVVYADKVKEAKEIIMKKLFSGERCVNGDEVMVGNEIQI